MHAGLSLDIRARRRAGAIAFTLGGLPVSAAYGLRRLLSGYGGALIRARRSSDNAEIDIGSDASGWLDVGGLLAWAGSSSVYAKTLYDQSGQGLHLSQTTAANQPRLVNAGVPERAPNGRPWMRILGGQALVGTYMAGQLASGGAAGSLSIVAAATAALTVNASILACGYGAGAGAERRIVAEVSAGRPMASIFGEVVPAPNAWGGVLRSIIAKFSSASISIHVDGDTPAGITPVGTVSTAASGSILLGPDANYGAANAAFIAEVAIFSAGLSAEQMVRLRANHQSVWGTP